MVNNWCWAEGSWFKPPHAIFFHASCNKHDKLYWEWRTLRDKYVADVLLLYYMIKDCLRVVWYKQPYYLLWAVLYFIGLSIWGYKAFYKNK